MPDKLKDATPMIQVIVSLVMLIATAILWVQVTSQNQAKSATQAIQSQVDSKLGSINQSVTEIKSTLKSLDGQIREVREWKAVTDSNVRRCIDHINSDHCLEPPPL